ncbi:integrase arm-type DNA-binding domain-containing protein [uncultured Duodenibacillus sp.]|uniref:integrase arm-type DNA-binding domain-containing protein n=1 Tax=Duodenibacillus massiliensis TaxID=1852381 RepID=UPI0035A72758
MRVFQNKGGKKGGKNAVTGGRRYEFGLGAAKTLSLKAAQVKADQCRGLVASGYDPRTAASAGSGVSRSAGRSASAG